MALMVTDATYNDVVATEKLVVLDFSAHWCGPCQHISPIIDELAEEYAERVVIGKVDVDENNDIVAKFGIRNIPTVIFIKNGQVQERLVGSQSKKTFSDTIEKYL